jgi:hypothetical protein
MRRGVRHRLLGRRHRWASSSRGLLRNPSTRSNGLAATGAAWLLGANHYANKIEQTFAGHIGELRIVDRALSLKEFLNA